MKCRTVSGSVVDEYIGKRSLALGLSEYKETRHTRMGDAVSLQVVALKKPHIAHGASKWLHP